MLNEKINRMIMDSMMSHDEVRTRTLRAIKDAFLKWATAKENVGKSLDESNEINLIKKMIKTRTESADLYEQAGRIDLAESEKREIEVLEEFVPSAPTEKELIEKLIQISNTEHIPCERANMGVLIRKIKEAFPSADGSLVAKVVKSNIP